MVWWSRHLGSAIIRGGKGVVEQKCVAPVRSYIAFSSTNGLGEFRYPCGLMNCSSTNTLWPHQYLQHMGIFSSRNLLADADATPVSSPLTPVLDHGSGKTENQAVSKASKVQAVLKNIKQSPKKVNLVATLVRGMRVEDALLQLQVTVKRAAKTVYQVIHSARANATHNHGLDAERLLVAEAFVGKGFFKKRVSYHSKGRSGIKVRPECRLTVVVRETTPEEEAEIARIKVSKFKKLTRSERRLVPHKLIETTPIWSRKSKTNSREITVPA
ncbi:hypothetical protein Sjap_026139 [Stephania japonica]|uniref:Large ribosomal subunit protein uL22c n=1 Tax=Stephania japonica TaxID=461633 RepID=A0AAP0E646_9MAGN